MEKIIYNLTMLRSRHFLIAKYGKPFWIKFRDISNDTFSSILPKVPAIGNSVFSFNYEFGPCYIAWYKAFISLGLNNEEVDQNIWKMNEKMVTTIPKPLLHICGKKYINGFRKKAAMHVARQKNGGLYPYDWKIDYREINKNSFEIDITECGMIKLAKHFEVEGLLPGICRMDYLFSHIMGNGFVRNKTLGDGDECCNCHYDLEGSCDWSPEKGFVYRK